MLSRCFKSQARVQPSVNHPSPNIQDFSMHENSSVTGNQTPLPPDINSFRVFGLFNSATVISAAAVICLVFIVAIYIAAMIFFPWTKCDLAFSIIAAIGFTVFLITGAIANGMVFKALDSLRLAFVTPFILYHVFLFFVEIIIGFAALGQIVSDQDAQIDESDILARRILVISPLCATFQTIMIYIGYKYIQYVKNFAYFRALANSINPVMTFNDPILTPPTDETTIKPFPTL